MKVTSSDASSQSVDPSQKYSAGMQDPSEHPMWVSFAQSAISSSGLGIMVSEKRYKGRYVVGLGILVCVIRKLKLDGLGIMVSGKKILGRYTYRDYVG